MGFASADPAFDRVLDNHTGLLRYGNERLDRWGGVPGLARPAWIAKAVTSIAAAARLNPATSSRIARPENDHADRVRTPRRTRRSSCATSSTPPRFNRRELAGWACSPAAPTSACAAFAAPGPGPDRDQPRTTPWKDADAGAAGDGRQRPPGRLRRQQAPVVRGPLRAQARVPARAPRPARTGSTATCRRATSGATATTASAGTMIDAALRRADPDPGQEQPAGRDHVGFGQPEIATHLHNFHTAGRERRRAVELDGAGQATATSTTTMCRAGFTDPQATQETVRRPAREPDHAVLPRPPARVHLGQRLQGPGRHVPRVRQEQDTGERRQGLEPAVRQVRRAA